MKIVTSALAAAFLFVPLGIAAHPVAAAETLRIAEDNGGTALTLTGAKQAVARFLADSGQHQLRIGSAAFDREGNVMVEIVSIQGIPLRHVVVDAKSGAIADARTGASLQKKS
jgi:hypothetical protein